MAVSVTFTLDVEPDDGLKLQLANTNAQLLLRVLGLENGPYLHGEIPLPAARRALMRGRARFLPAYTRKTVTGPNFVHCGCDLEQLTGYLDRFERLLVHAAAIGATKVVFS